MAAVILVLGLLQAWAGRHSMQSDGISYLDMGDAIVRGDWRMALNGYWSPFIPFCSALANGGWSHGLLRLSVTRFV